MNKKVVYIVLSVIINLLISMGAVFAILLGMICITGLFRSPTDSEIAQGFLILICTYAAELIINYILYRIFRTRAGLTCKHFIIPVAIIFGLSIILTILLLL